jgi:hypothetical protein
MFAMRTLFGLGAPLALAGALAAQKPFEGSVTVKITSGGKSFESKTMSNGTRTRTEYGMGGQQAVMITDLSEGKSYTLIPSQKKYMVMDFKGMADALKEMGDKNSKPEKLDPSKMPKVTATGHKETIAGYSCEHYTLESEKGLMDFCVAKGLGTFSPFGGGGGMGGAGSSAAMAKLVAANPGYKELLDLFKDGFFPLKMTMSENGQVKMETEVTQIEKGNVPAALLAIPSDYTELKMPSFGPKRP